MTTALIVVGFAALAGWVGVQLVATPPLFIGGIVALCAGCTYLGSRLGKGGRGGRGGVG